jgi:hypothetical protein
MTYACAEDRATLESDLSGANAEEITLVYADIIS